jgi:hypothetical protein
VTIEHRDLAACRVEHGPAEVRRLLHVATILQVLDGMRENFGDVRCAADVLVGPAPAIVLVKERQHADDGPGRSHRDRQHADEADYDALRRGFLDGRASGLEAEMAGAVVARVTPHRERVGRTALDDEQTCGPETRDEAIEAGAELLSVQRARQRGAALRQIREPAPVIEQVVELRPIASGARTSVQGQSNRDGLQHEENHGQRAQ